MDDIGKGKKIFVQKYAQCHKVGKEGNCKTKPDLHGLLGKKTGQGAGFSYMGANKSNSITRERTPGGIFGESQKYIPEIEMMPSGIEKGKWQT
ncbi:cytochrome c-like [Grammomys surdaster]|uniref:cytochrome c-like n=1 Tax=Grammomys surdaster TaxID=491861 RepID=UPI0010A0365E|nr:cytochrome c-like [Grammomys surdaster]